MTTSFPASAEEAALPPGLAEKAAALVEPGEAVLWAGRGGRAATFAALWPYPAILLVLLALLVRLGFALEGQPAVLRSDSGGPLDGLEVPAPFVLAPFAGACLWIIGQFVHRVLWAPRTLWVLTPERLIVKLGWRRAIFSLARSDRAVVSGVPGRNALALEVSGDGSRGSRARPSLFGVANADASIEVLERLGVPVSDERQGPEAWEDDPSTLAPGESVRWSGRRGFGAVGADRLFMAAFCAPVPLIFFGSLWHIWSSAESTGNAGGLVWGVIMTWFLLSVMGGMVWFVHAHAPAFLGELYLEIFGRLAVTDRRILFTAPLTGAIRRDIPADRIVDALLVDLDARGRGYISLTLKGEDGEKEETVDLYSVPDPDNALDSIGRLIRRP
jgi:hypothetical protein